MKKRFALKNYEIEDSIDEIVEVAKWSWYQGENRQMPISKKTIQHFAPLPKLIREMPFFWNSIFAKSSYKKKKFIEPYSSVLRSL